MAQAKKEEKRTLRIMCHPSGKSSMSCVALLLLRYVEIRKP